MTSERYELEVLPRAVKDLAKLHQNREQASRELLKLETNPMAGHALKGNLRGTRSLEFNLKGGGAYRAVYVVLGRTHPYECASLFGMSIERTLVGSRPVSDQSVRM